MGHPTNSVTCYWKTQSVQRTEYGFYYIGRLYSQGKLVTTFYPSVIWDFLLRVCTTDLIFYTKSCLRK